MHIKPEDRSGALSAAHRPGRNLDSAPVKKGRVLGTASRVSSKETTESPLRVFVSAIGQSISARTPLRKKCSPHLTAKDELASCSSPGHGTDRPASDKVSKRQPSTSSKPSTPTLLSSSSSTTRSLASKDGSSMGNIKTPLSLKDRPSMGSTRTPLSSKPSNEANIRTMKTPSTPTVRKRPVMPPKTPTAASRVENMPTTPVSRCSNVYTPSKKGGTQGTPVTKESNMSRNHGKLVLPATPLTGTNAIVPTTPVGGHTPLNSQGSSIPFYTPKSTLASKSGLPSPLQPRCSNIPSESSRRLHFGINLSAVVEQENMGLSTPCTQSSARPDALYSFDKNRLAQIKARRNSLQTLLTSPAQRVKVREYTQPFYTPSRSGVVEETTDRGSLVDTCRVGTTNLTKRRVANSLF